MKHYIYVKDGLFFASREAPFAEKLVNHFWRFASPTELFTNEITNVVPFVKYLEPRLKDILLKTAEKHKASWAEKPPEGFNPPVPEGEKLFDYQLASAHFILERDSTLLADPPGMGKSAIIATVANAMDAKSCLIVCPSIAKYNWFNREWPRWSTLKHLKVGVVEPKTYPEDADVLIINYDIVDRYKEKLNERTWDLLACDESHRLANQDAKRTQMILGGKIAEAIPFKKRVFASATPLDRPSDLWTMCRACDPRGLGADKKKYERYYCEGHQTSFGWSARGASNLKELGATMRSRFMVRHDESILDLPPLSEDLFLLPPVKIVLEDEDTFVQENIEALMSLAVEVDEPTEDVAKNYHTIIGKALVSTLDLVGKPAYAAMFTKFAELREKTGLAKLPSVVDYVKQVERPIVIFCYHRSVLNGLREAFPDFAYIMGGMTSKRRGEMVKIFQDGEKDGIILNIDAGGEAVTLTRSNQLVFAETDWRGRAIEQARKRIHRLSQTKPCSAIHLCAAESFDAVVAKVALSKAHNTEEVLN